MLLLPRVLLVILLATSVVFLQACAKQSSVRNAAQLAQLEQGKQEFLEGRYRIAFNRLQPLALQGNPDAEYAIGYMYYYGKGVDIDPEVAKIWLRRAASQVHELAIEALENIDQQESPMGSSFLPNVPEQW